MQPHRQTSCLRQFVRLSAILFAVFATTAFAVASPGDEGITVRGEGSATARPTEIEMSATLSGEAPLAADALVKFREAHKRAFAAIAALKNPDLSIEPGGVSVNSGANNANTQMMIMRGMTPTNTSQSVKLTETSRIVLVHTDKLPPDELLAKLLKILDVAKDAGFQIGPAPATNYYQMQIQAQEGGTAASVSFKLPDSTSVRDQAYKAAVADAKAKARRLADLAGAKLGRIVAVHDSDAGKGEASNMMMYVYGMLSNKSVGDDKAISGPTSGNLVVRANLEIQFELAK